MDVLAGACTRTLRKSTKSGNTNCVEAGACSCHGAVIGDTKDPSGPVLSVSAASFAAFTRVAASGGFAA